MDFSEIFGAVFVCVTVLAAWPWAMARIYSRLDIDSPIMLGLTTGPLWLGWLLGLAVEVFPRSTLPVYTAFAVGGAAVLFLAGRPLPKVHFRMPKPLEMVLLSVVSVGIGFLILNALLFPTRDHDVLIIDLFATHLRDGWDYRGLPRYAPDERGFYYPLSHPPAMMSLLAWIKSYSDWGWVVRAPSAFLIAGFAASLYAAAERLKRQAGLFGLALLFSSPLFLTFLVNNSQDIYRHAGLAAALLALTACKPSHRQSVVVAGALIGLTASYHSLGLPLVGLLPLGLLLAGMFSRDAWKVSLLTGATALLFAIYPYLANVINLDSTLIATRSVHDIPTLNRYLRNVMSEYANVPTDWGDWSLHRLGFLLPANAGLIGIFFLVAASAGIAFRKYRPPESRIWLVFALVGFAFIGVVLDAGNLIFSQTGLGFWSNLRYPQTIFPLFVLVAASFVALLNTNLPVRAAKIVSVLLVIACLYGAKEKISLNSKLEASAGRECILCSDKEKLDAHGGTRIYDAIAALEQMHDRRCLTFREAEYFAWSQLSGAAYYSLVAEQALAAGGTDASFEQLRQAGLNCVLLNRYGPMRTNLEENESFMGLAKHPKVWPLLFYDVEVWLLEEEPLQRGQSEALEVPAGPTQNLEVVLGPVGRFEVALSFASEHPLNAVFMLAGENASEILMVENNVAGGTRLVPVTTVEGYERMTAWFSRPVSVTSLSRTVILTK